NFIEGLEQTDPVLLNYQPMIESRERYRRAETEDNDRKSHFAEALRDARDAPLTELNPSAIIRAREMSPRSTAGKAEAEEAIRGVLSRRQARRVAEVSKSDVTVSPVLDQAELDLDRARQRSEATSSDREASRDVIERARREVEKLIPHLTLASEHLR